MKKRWMLLGFLLVTIAFTGIMIYIRADNNSAVRNFFLHSWHKNYVVEEKNLAYINTTPKQEQVTVLSEGQGYGMFIAAHDPSVKESNFAKLVQYYLKHRDRNTQLMAWRQTKKNGKWSSERNSATDGDLFIAKALFLAAKRWKNPAYQRQGQKLIADILRYEYNTTTHALTVGNWADSKSKYYNLMRTSDVLPTMFDQFYRESNDSRWLLIKKTMLKRLNQLSHQHKSGLVPDFAWLTSKDAKPGNNYQSASFSAPIYIAVNENRNQGYDNLFASQQYIFAKKLPKNNYYDAALTTMATILTPAHRF